MSTSAQLPSQSSITPTTPTRIAWHPGPAWGWLLSFVACIAADWFLGRWLLLPCWVSAFYLGMTVIDLFTYPLLEKWRKWLRPRGVIAWYIVEVGVMWIGTGIVLLLLIPVWQNWRWHGPLLLQIVGGIGMALSVAVGFWACGQMGWARVLFAPALFPPGKGAEENKLPQRLVVSGPYRYVRNPLYTTDMTVMLSTALLTQHWLVILTLIVYIAQLVMQLRLEERELKQRFGAAYARYLQRVPRFIPRLSPVDPKEIYGE